MFGETTTLEYDTVTQLGIYGEFRILVHMSLKDMREHISTQADDQGNLWCHLEGCRGTYMYTPYRVNIWGLRKPVANQEETVTQLGIYGEFRILVHTSLKDMREPNNVLIFCNMRLITNKYI